MWYSLRYVFLIKSKYSGILNSPLGINFNNEMNVNPIIIRLAICVAFVLSLASCRSSKKAVEGAEGGVTKPTETVVTTPADKPTKATAAGTNFTSKVKVTITQNDKSISTTGMLRMRYDDVIQITLVDPFFGITEVGRMEMSPDSVLIIDRVNKRYVSIRYDEFDVLRRNSIDFQTAQEYFWNEAQRSDALSYSMPAKTPIKLDLKLSDKGSSSSWNAHTEVSSKYSRTDANKLFNSLMTQ